jgi:hypothetical protein
MNSVTNAVMSLIDSGGHGCHGESARRVDFDNFTRWITKTALKIKKIHPQAYADDNVAREARRFCAL